MKTVLLLIDSFIVGGSERQLTETAIGLKRGHHGIRPVAAALRDGRFRETLEAEGVETEVFSRRSRFDPSPFRDLLRFVRRHKVDLIHSWAPFADLFVPPVKLLTGVPWIAGSLQTVFGNRDGGYILYKSAWRFADLMVANSQAGLDAFSIPASRGEVLYNGVDLERLRSGADAPVDLPRQARGKFIIGMIANLTQYKDHFTAIDALEILRQHGVPAHLVLLGDGPTRPEIERRIAERGLAEDVTLAGQRLDVEHWIPHFQVGLLTSTPLGEGVSNALLESMALGKPVVASDIGGNRELVEEGVVGFRVPLQDPAAVAERIETLYRDDSLRRKLGENAARHVEKRFTRDKMIEHAVDLYRRFLRE